MVSNITGANVGTERPGLPVARFYKYLHYRLATLTFYPLHYNLVATSL